jgi:competence protein ComEA
VRIDEDHLPADEVTGDSAPFERPAGLAGLVDEWLLWIEHRAERHRTTVLAVVVLMIGVGIGWSWLSAGERSAVEDAIPFAPQADGIAGPAGSADGATVPSGDAEGSAGARGAASAAPSSGVEAGDRSDLGPDSDGDSAASSSGQPPQAPLVLHVVGAVARPGLVEVAPGARVAEAIEAAGGAHADADLDRLNLAAPVVDGMQIRVPSIGDGNTAEGERTSGEGGPLIQLPPRLDANPPTGPVVGPVDLNADPAGRLESLPGVGPATAAAIIEWRDQHGPFVVVDDLLDVPGIGPAKLAAIRDLVEV